MPAEEVLKIEQDLPNTIFPSDHLRIAAQFEIFYKKKSDHI